MKQLTTLLMAVTTAVLALQVMTCNEASAASYGDVTVNEMATPQPEYHMHGYVAFRYSLFNDSKDKEHTVKLLVPGNSWGGGGEVTRSVTLLAGAQGVVTMWVPATVVRGQGTAVYIDGRLQKDVLGTTLPDSPGYSGSGTFGGQVLFSQSVDSRFRDELTTLKTASAKSSYSSTGDEFGQRTTLPVNQWSESWLGYSGFDGLVMTSNEWQSLPGPVSDAIAAWVEVGGSLLVVGEFKPPVRWQKQMTEWSRAGMIKKLETAPVGLGVVGKIDTDSILGWSDADLRTAHRIMWETLGTRTERLSIGDANNVFTVTDSLGIPARGMLAIMLLFAILIGPVNMYWCAKIDKRLWTLVTIPAAAIIFSAGVFAYTMLADGISALGRAKTLTYLDQDNHRAVTLGWLGYYAPLQPSGGLHFDVDTELTAQFETDSYGYGGSQDNAMRMTDWSGDQHLTSGWVSSRIPSHFVVRKSQSRRERLEVTMDDQGQVSVVNGLGSDILELHLADADGSVFKASGVVAAGQKVKLQATKQTVGNGVLVVASWRSSPSDLDVHDPVRTLKANQYVAVLKEAVFIEQGVSQLKSWKTESTVIGSFTANSQEQ